MVLINFVAYYMGLCLFTTPFELEKQAAAAAHHSNVIATTAVVMLLFAVVKVWFYSLVAGIGFAVNCFGQSAVTRQSMCVGGDLKKKRVCC